MTDVEQITNAIEKSTVAILVLMGLCTFIIGMCIPRK